MTGTWTNPRYPRIDAYVIPHQQQARTDVTEVAVSGRKVTLTLEGSAEDADDDVRLTYRANVQPTLRSAAGVHAETVRNYQVSVLIAEVIEPTPTTGTRSCRAGLGPGVRRLRTDRLQRILAEQWCSIHLEPA